MRNNLTKSIVIICQSDIILTGLALILKDSIAGEIIKLHRSDQIIDFPGLEGIVIVIATESEFEKSNVLLKNVLTSASSVIFYNLVVDSTSKDADNSINLFDSPSLICYKVNESFNSISSGYNKESDTELTKREIEVLQLLTKGYSNKEIADQLFVSTHTVISHRKNISEKTGIKSASGLTMYAILKKIIDVSDINPNELI